MIIILKNLYFCFVLIELDDDVVPGFLFAGFAGEEMADCSC